MYHLVCRLGVEVKVELSGQTHKVITALWATDAVAWSSAESTALVTFKPVDEGFIRYYVEHFKPLDKAGAYGAQEWFGHLAIDRIEGTFDNVKGLPLDATVEALGPWLKDA